MEYHVRKYSVDVYTTKTSINACMHIYIVFPNVIR